MAFSDRILELEQQINDTVKSVEQHVLNGQFEVAAIEMTHAFVFIGKLSAVSDEEDPAAREHVSKIALHVHELYMQVLSCIWVAGFETTKKDLKSEAVN